MKSFMILFYFLLMLYVTLSSNVEKITEDTNTKIDNPDEKKNIDIQRIKTEAPQCTICFSNPVMWKYKNGRQLCGSCFERMLKSSGALNVNMFKKNERTGLTGLYYSSKLGYLDAVKYWIENGANVDTTDESRKGFTPLMAAVINGHFEVVKYLVEEGKANVELTNFEGKGNPILYSVSRGHLKIFQFLSKKMILSKRELGHYLCLSAQYGYLDFVKYFIEELKVTPHSVSDQFGRSDFKKYLMDNKNSEPISALDAAEENDQYEVVNFLSKVISEKNFCAVCQDWAKFKCSLCKNVHYCGPEHQKDHWLIHKKNCIGKKENLQKY